MIFHIITYMLIAFDESNLVCKYLVQLSGSRQREGTRYFFLSYNTLITLLPLNVTTSLYSNETTPTHCRNHSQAFQ